MHGRVISLFDKFILVLRLTAFCDHGCWICLQKGNHSNKTLDIEAVERAAPTFLQFVKRVADKFEVVLTGTGDPLFYSQFKEIVELAFGKMGADSVLLQTSGFESEAEFNNFASIQDIAWKKFADARVMPPPLCITTTIFDDEKALARFKRMIEVDFPGYQVAITHRPDISWEGTWQEQALFYRVIEEAGYELVQEYTPPEVESASERRRRFETKRLYRRNYCSLWTEPGYVIPIGAAEERLEQWVYSPIKDRSGDRLLRLTVTEDGAFTPCATSQHGFGNIRDPNLDIAAVLERMSSIKGMSHELIRSSPHYQEKTAHKCWLCPLMFNNDEMHEALASA